jgi:hypothetical protein
MFQLNPSVFGSINSKSDYDRQKQELMRQKQMQDLQMSALQNQAQPDPLGTEQLLAKAIQLGGVGNLSPQEQAQLQAADIAQRTKQTVDRGGNVITNRSYFDLMGMPPSQVLNMPADVMTGQRGQGIVNETGASQMPTMTMNTATADPMLLANQEAAAAQAAQLNMPDMPNTDIGFVHKLPLPPEPDTSGLSPYSAEDARKSYLEDVRNVQMENAKLDRERQVSLSKVKGQTDLINKTIGALIDEEGNLKKGVDQALGGVFGLQGLQSSIIPLTKEQRRVQPFIEQLQGQAFLQAFDSLKGGGPITDIEGEQATRALARLKQTQDEEDFAAALMDLRDVANAALTRASGGKVQTQQNDPLGLFNQ